MTSDKPALKWTHNPHGGTYRADVGANASSSIHIALYIRPSFDLKKELGYMNGPHVGYRWQVYRIGKDEHATLLHQDVVYDATEAGLNKAKVNAEAYIAEMEAKLNQPA
jgi:hypothetical protein